MKKTLSIVFLVATALCAHAQVSFSIRLAPAQVINRMEDTLKTYEYTTYKNSFGLTFGPQLDFKLRDDISFTTGLWFTALGMNYQEQRPAEESYYYRMSTQYVVLPIGFKAFTNNIKGGDSRIYFSILGTGDVKVSEKYKSSDNPNAPSQNTAKNQARFGAGMQLASGLDFKLGNVGGMYVGAFFNHDLFNRASTSKDNITIGSETYSYAQSYTQKRSMVGIEIGFKFE